MFHNTVLLLGSYPTEMSTKRQGIGRSLKACSQKPCLSCSAALTDHRPDWLINNRNVFISHVIGGWEAQVKVLADSRSGEGPPCGSQMAVLSLSPHLMERERELFGASCVKILIPFMKTPPS